MFFPKLFRKFQPSFHSHISAKKNHDTVRKERICSIFDVGLGSTTMPALRLKSARGTLTADLVGIGLVEACGGFFGGRAGNVFVAPFAFFLFF